MTTADIRPLRDAQEQWRREYLTAAYVGAGGNASAAARALGMHRSHLQRLLHIYGIPKRKKVCEG